MERLRLQSEIMNIIRPHRHRDKKPPFSVGEMAVMAVLCNNVEPLGRSEILTWILRVFTFFGWTALEEFANWHEMQSPCEPPEEVIPGFRDVFRDWELPFLDVEGDVPVTTESCDAIVVPTQSGRIFLRKWLDPERGGHFRFLDLPAELRNTIYEMVYTFPRSGLRAEDFNGKEFRMLGRYDDNLPEEQEWGDYSHSPDGHLTIPPAIGVLRLLLVNKQILREAKPFFYQLNHFHLADIESFVRFTTGLAPDRVHHLRSLAIDLCPAFNSEVQNFQQAVRRLSQQLEKLHKLSLSVSLHAWLRLPESARRRMGRVTNFNKIEQIPGFKDLALVANKAEILEFDGKCEVFEEFIRAEMEKSRATANDGGKEKKRRRSLRGDGDLAVRKTAKRLKKATTTSGDGD